MSDTLDKNKTPLTHRVTAIAAAYLDGIGCKPVETEVEVQRGWIADVASYWYPSSTEAKKLWLDKRAAELLGVDSRDHYRCQFLPRTYGHGPFSVLVEVKTSQSDFQRDKKKWLALPPASICFVAYQRGLIEKEDIPEGWYGLETSMDASKLLRVHRHKGDCHPQHPGLLVDFIAQVGIRRDHRTRYAAHRAFFRSHNAEQRERDVRFSAAGLLQGLHEWIKGDGYRSTQSAAELMSEIGVKKPPKYCVEAIRFFEAMRKKEAEAA